MTVEVLRNMADSRVLPFDMVEYHHALARHAGELVKQYGDAIRSHLGQPVIGMYAKPNYAKETVPLMNQCVPFPGLIKVLFCSEADYAVCYRLFS